MQFPKIPLVVIRLALATSALFCALLFIGALMIGIRDGSLLLLGALLMVFPTVGTAQWMKAREKAEADRVEMPAIPTLAVYAVIYLGGHPTYPTRHAEQIDFAVAPDSFHLWPTDASGHWFEGVQIPYERVTDVRIVERQVGTTEALLGGLGAHLLTQPNNIHIEYRSEDGNALVLRLEMLTGLTVMGQATACREFEDLLRTARLREMFRAAPNSTAHQDVGARISLLAELHAAGSISEAEFNAKKTELLALL